MSDDCHVLCHVTITWCHVTLVQVVSEACHQSCDREQTLPHSGPGLKEMESCNRLWEMESCDRPWEMESRLTEKEVSL